MRNIYKIVSLAMDYIGRFAAALQSLFKRLLRKSQHSTLNVELKHILSTFRLTGLLRRQQVANVFCGLIVMYVEVGLVYTTESIMIAAGVTVLLVLALTIFAFQVLSSFSLNLIPSLS